VLPREQITEIFAASPGAAWIAVGIAGAAVAVLAVRRLRRLILLATVAGVGLAVAWNAGLLPLVS